MVSHPPLEDALRSLIRAELNVLFEEKLKPLLDAKRVGAMEAVSRTPAFVSTATAAKMVDVTQATIQSWVKTGKLPAFRAGGRLLRVKVEDLEAFMSHAASAEVVDIEATARRIMMGGGQRSRSR